MKCFFSFSDLFPPLFFWLSLWSPRSFLAARSRGKEKSSTLSSPPPPSKKTLPDLAELLKEHASNPTHAEFELAKVQGMLDAIDSARLANSPQEFGVRDGKVPAGQAVCHSLLEDCYKLVRKIQEKE